MPSQGDHLQPGEAPLPSQLFEARDRGELIICVGPGLAKDADLPSSRELARALLDDAEASARNLDAATLREWIALGRIEQALEALERRMGSRFRRVVERELGVRERAVPPLARAIAGLERQLRAVYTTGIHRLVERAFADAWPSFSTAQADLARRRKVIVKLCGTLEFPETWALTRAAREREFGERALRRQLLAAAGRAHCLLFVGFDPGDELSERLFSIVAPASDSAQTPAHFVILERCDLEQRALLESRGLQLLAGPPTSVLTRLAGEVAEPGSGTDSGLPACPYPGLQSFDSSLAAVFHGRRAEISAAASHLGGPPEHHRRWLAIDGSSGVGKSSFVHAGLVPALQRGFAEATASRWWVATLRPDRRPLESLFEALAAAMATQTPVAAAQLFDPERAGTHDAASRVTAFVRDHKPDKVALLVVIDQLEEVVTLASSCEREHLAACLSALIRQQLIYLVTTLRSDFTAAVSATMPALARLLNEAGERFTLAPISRVGLRAAIAEPAAQLGVTFEAELVERIASDAAQHLGRRHRDEDGVVRTDDAALPLVAHVLRGLWDAGAAEDGAVSFAEYEALGGVSGALSRSADALLAALDERQRVRARELLLRMVNLDGDRLTRRSLSRAEARSLAGGEREGEALLQLLSGRAGPRLIVIRGEGNEALVDVVHEALLREWDTMRGWIAASRAQLARDEALTRRAAAWTDQGRPWRSLPRGPERRELLRGRARGSTAEDQREYQRAMRAAAWLRGCTWLGLSAVLGGLGALALAQVRDARGETLAKEQEIAAVTQDKEMAERGKAIAETELDETQTRAMIKNELDAHQCREALAALLASPYEFDDLLARAARCDAVVGELGRTPGASPVTTLAFAPESHQVWIGREDGSLTRWSTDTTPTTLELHHEAIEHVEFGPSGDRVILGGRGTTMLFDRQGEAVTAQCPGHDPSLSPDGRSFATRDRDRVYVYNSSTGELVSQLSTPGVRAHVFAPRGEAVIVASGSTGGSTIANHALGHDELLGPPIEVPGLVREIAAGPRGDLVASTADDNRTRLWSLERGEEAAGPLPLSVVNKSYKYVDFAPAAADMIVTLQSNQRIVVTDLELQPLFERDPVDPEVRAQFSPDARWLLAADLHRRSASLRAARSGQEVARVHTEGSPSTLAFSGDGERVVIGEASGATSMWALDARDHWRAPPHAGAVYSLVFSPHEFGVLYSGSSDGSLQRWGLDGSTTTHTLNGWVIAAQADPHASGGLALSTSGALFEWDEDGATPRLSPPWCAPKQAALSSSGDHLGLICDNGEVELWRLVNGEPRRIPRLPGRIDSAVTALALAPGGQGLALGDSEGTIQHWQIDGDGRVRLERTIEHAHAVRVRALAYDAAAVHLVSGGNDDRVKVWTANEVEPEELSLAHNVRTVAIAADASMIAVGDPREEGVVVWDFEHDSRELGSCEGAGVQALAFSPDKHLLAAGCSDGEVHVWPLSATAHRELGCRRLANTGPLPTQCLPRLSRTDHAAFH